MKLVVLVPSREYMDNAGARIRYARISSELAQHGVDLAMVEIARFDPLRTPCDVAIVSKCYDAQALVVAALLSRRRIPVGVDLFDDYFSQASDSRLCRFRNWLRQMLALSDFALCSTTSLVDTIGRWHPDLQVHLLRDPVAPFAPPEIAQKLSRKLSAAQSDRTLRFVWFGVGDNPHFPVGLSDLAAFRSALAPLAGGDLAVELNVLTNRRALDANGLAMLGQLPVPVCINEWSEERERELLESSFACFLPVNAQPFSTAKSLNRALTALSAGCQVLTVGFPLYAPLAPLLYGSAESLIEDFNSGRMRLSPATLPHFEQLALDLASAGREAAALSSFLQEAVAARLARPASSSPTFLLHGVASNQRAHDLARASGVLSIATPFCAMPLDFDAIVELRDGSPRLLVSSRVIGKLTPQFRKKGGAERKLGKRRFREFDYPPLKSTEHSGKSLPWQLAVYPRVLAETASLISEAFGTGTLILSENSGVALRSGTVAR